MPIIRSNLFKNFPELIFGFSTRDDSDPEDEFYFNMSFNVGDDEERVRENQSRFCKELGLSLDKIVFQKQVHSDKITVVDYPGIINESDALITTKFNIGLAISSADCAAIFIYDKNLKIILAVHSGWRGSRNKILMKTLTKLSSEFNSNPSDLIAYIAPSITQKNYEVGSEVAELFDNKYILIKNEKYFLNIPLTNYDMLLSFGVPHENIELSGLCSFEENQLLHSYRRDREKSGRALGIIAMKEK